MSNAKNSAVVATLVLLTALGGCASSGAHRSTGEAVDDSVLTARVKTALVTNDNTKARQIDVEVYRGQVQLNGFVDSEAARSEAAATARSVEGVHNLQNNL